MFSALKVAAGPAFLSATRASLRVLEPMASTPFLSFLNHRAAGSPSGGREDALLEKSDTPRLRTKGQRPTGWCCSLFTQTWRPTLPAGKHGTHRAEALGCRWNRKPLRLHFRRGRGASWSARSEREGSALAGRGRGACMRHFRARRGERGRHGGWRARWVFRGAGAGRRGWAPPRAPAGPRRPLPRTLVGVLLLLWD